MTVHLGADKITELYLGGTKIGEAYYGSTLVYRSAVTLTINPTPADATVTFTGQGTVSGNSITVSPNTSVTYTVSKTDYTTQTATVTVTANQTINVTLVYTPYTPNQVLYESSTGGASKTLNLLVAGKYQVICIAGGGGGASTNGKVFSSRRYYKASGGSGSGFDCVFQLSAGSYEVAVGAGGSGYFKNYGNGMPSGGTASDGNDSRFGTCYAHAGKGGNGTIGGDGGAAPTLTYTRTTITLNTAGNSGSGSTSSGTVSGGAAVYSSKGTGGSCTDNAGNNGTDGYVKVVYKGA